MLEAIIIALLVLLIVTSLLVAVSSDLFAAVMLFGMFSLLLATLFVALGAPDVAFTEAAVGGGISTILFLATISATRGIDTVRTHGSLAALLICAVVGGLLIYASLDMPLFGDASAPAHDHVARYYLNQTASEIGVPNVVTAVLASYRGIDTLGELAVIFTAGIGSYALLISHRRKSK